MKKERNIKRKESILAQSLHMPEELMQGDSIISLTGRHKAWIENYKGIIEYNDCRIFLQLKNGKVLFSGKQMHIDFYTCDEMQISGMIEEICFT